MIKPPSNTNNFDENILNTLNMDDVNFENESSQRNSSMLKFVVNTDNFDKVFLSYDLDKKTAVLKPSDDFNENSIIFIHDPLKGNWVFCRGILYSGTIYNLKTINGESIIGKGDIKTPDCELSVDYSFQLEGKYIFMEGDYDETTETITPLHAEYDEQNETIIIYG